MKKRSILLLVVSSLFLSGCSTQEIDPKDALKDYLLHDNQQYADYLSMKELHDEDIDDDGYYTSDEIKQDVVTVPEGAIHVSFASNSLLNVSYYLDSEHSEAIDKQNCYLFPGDTIYAKIDTTSLVQANTYDFKGFQMAVFGGESPKYDYAFFEGDKITLPSDLEYPEISIIPAGEYTIRDLSFNAVYNDSEGNPFTISPRWEICVDDESYTTIGNSYSVDAINPFRVKAHFDPKEYYLIKSEPQYERYSEEDGEVVFAQYESKNAINDYQIELGKKIVVEIKSIVRTGPIKITVENNTYDNPTFPFTFYAQLGSKVRIESTGNISSVDAKNLTRLTQNGWIYSVSDDDNTFEFNPTDYVFEHGKVTFYTGNHKEIKEKTELQSGDVIYYKGIPDEGYSFIMGEGEKELKVDSNIIYMLKKELSFKPKQTIHLPQPEKGGTITYYINDKKASGEQAYFSPETDKLTASFSASSRYKVNNLSDHAKCKVTSKNHEITFIDNDGKEISIGQIFVLSESQKANVTVDLDYSVGTEIKFNIFNGDTLLNPNQKSYVEKAMFDDWHNPLGFDSNTIVDSQKAETVSGIKITASDGSLLRNEGLRIDVTKKDASKNETKEIFYILSGNGSQSISTDSGDSTYYTDVKIKISKVKGSYFNKDDHVFPNTDIAFKYDDVSSKAEVKSGAFIDDSRTIRMIVTAKSPYQLYEKSSVPFVDRYSIIDKYEVKFDYKDLSSEFATMQSKLKLQT